MFCWSKDVGAERDRGAFGAGKREQRGCRDDRRRRWRYSRRERPTRSLLDIQLPDMTGLDIAEELTRRHTREDLHRRC